MKQKIVKYFNIANELNDQSKGINEVILALKNNGANYAATFLTLSEMGFNDDDIDDIIERSQVWRGFKRSFEDMFFDFVELEDDAINKEN